MTLNSQSETDKVSTQSSSPTLEEIRNARKKMDAAQEAYRLTKQYIVQTNMTDLFSDEIDFGSYHSFNYRTDINLEEMESLNKILKANYELFVEFNAEAERILLNTDQVIKEKEAAEERVAILEKKLAELKSKVALLNNHPEQFTNSSSADHRSLAEPEIE